MSTFDGPQGAGAMRCGMTVTHLGRTAGESYVMRLGHDPDTNQDILVRTYTDGRETVSLRPGKGDTSARWSPEYVLEQVAGR